jgi:hypothetical protein
VPAVRGGESAPLDLGRTCRLFTDKQRQALALIYDTCAIAGCDRPFDWCEIHHLRAWAKGGRTDLADGGFEARFARTSTTGAKPFARTSTTGAKSFGRASTTGAKSFARTSTTGAKPVRPRGMPRATLVAVDRRATTTDRGGEPT